MSKVVPLEGFGGGSSPLNFKIVAYATEEELAAAQPKENTIGIVTTTPINNWVFDSEDPYEILISYQSQTCTVISPVTYLDNMLTLNSTPTAGKSYIININGIEHSIIITNSTSESSEDGYIDLVSSDDGYAVRVNDVIESPCTIEMYSKKPENGFIWIASANKGAISFNALKKNSIILCPLFAKQYVGSAWVNVDTQIYQSGKWNELWDGYLYKRGDEYETITGGWQSRGVNVTTAGAITKNADSMICPPSAVNAYQGVSPVNKIDLTKYRTLHVIYKHATTGIYITIANSYPTSTYAAKLYSEQIQKTEVETTVDISSLEGEYYINIATPGVLNDLYIYEVWLT